MAYVRKTRDRWDIETNYGYGWDVECSEYSFKEAKERLKEYRENVGSGYGARVRLKKHRESVGVYPMGHEEINGHVVYVEEPDFINGAPNYDKFEGWSPEEVLVWLNVD